uniref:Uncharacterized protein n=1 Tax=Sphaerodactylus townsendi TaxID=933632 RepID=A0ACB8F0L7_9SAUR
MLHLVALLLLFVIFRLVLGLPWLQVIPALLIFYLGSGGWRFLRVVIKTARRDITTGTVVFLTRIRVWWYVKQKYTIPKIFQETVQRHPEKVALIFQGTGESWTFRDLDEYSNRVANLLYGQGFRSGDVITLFMESCNKYVGLWLGMAKIGVEAALVNSHVRKESLLHCINISQSKAVVFGGELAEGETGRGSGRGRGFMATCQIQNLLRKRSNI